MTDAPRARRLVLQGRCLGRFVWRTGSRLALGRFLPRLRASEIVYARPDHASAYPRPSAGDRTRPGGGARSIGAPAAATAKRDFQSHRRPGGGDFGGALWVVCARALFAGGGAGAGQDAAGPYAGALARTDIFAHPIHAGPDAVR